jgi:hypothetical protein
MFTLDATIDAVQNSKKQFVKTFVQNEKVADAMNTFIDEQASYTKKAVKVGTDTFATLTSEMVKTSQEAMKFDYAKLMENVGNSFKMKK